MWSDGVGVVAGFGDAIGDSRLIAAAPALCSL